MSSPNCRKWSAVENRQPPFDPKKVPFIVQGEVETNNGGIRPVLSRAEPQGINPRILLLDLALKNSGAGTADINFRPTRHDETITEGQFDSVDIRYQSAILVSIKVEVVS